MRSYELIASLVLGIAVPAYVGGQFDNAMKQLSTGTPGYVMPAVTPYTSFCGKHNEDCEAPIPMYYYGTPQPSKGVTAR